MCDSCQRLDYTLTEYQAMYAQVQDIQRSKANGKDDWSHGTIFAELINSDLPPPELSADRLMDEAGGIIGAAIETTKWATVVTVFHILDNPPILQRLRRILEKAIPDPKTLPSLAELEQIPYFMACIQEGTALPSHPLDSRFTLAL